MSEIYFTKEHEWVKIDGTSAVCGISEHAAHELGDVTFVELPAVGKQVKREEVMAAIESVKAAADVKLPITGKVFEVNDELTNTPEQINTDPFGTAWILKVELSDPSELNVLMDADAYAKYCETRGH